MKENALTSIWDKVQSFPTMPTAAAELLKLLDDPDTSASQVESVLRYEPGLTANILKLSNSAYFGVPSKIGSLKQAIVLLGWRRLIQLVMTSCVSTVLDESIPGYDLGKGELWRHSVAVSVAAEIMVKELNFPAIDEIFTAALLHDVGKLVLGAFVREDLKEIEQSAAEGLSFEQAERTVLGTDHTEIGAAILKSWSFPDRLVSAVKWHHDPDSAKNELNTAIDIVHIADVLCLMIGFGVGREGLHYQPSTSATERLGLNESHLEMVASQTVQWTDELLASMK